MATTLRATHIGAIASRALAPDRSEVVGDVVAAFTNSFYVKTIDRQLLFFNGRQLKSPITINLNSSVTIEQAVRPFDRVTIQGDEVRIGGATSIQLARAERAQDLTLSALRFTLNRKSLDLASLILVVIDNTLSILDPAGLAHAGAVSFISQGVSPLRESEDLESFAIAARPVVGLGGGFTPSGDDLLGGFLATYNSFAESIGRQIILLDSGYLENSSTWLSAKLLDYMQRRVLDDQVSALMDTAALGDNDGFLLALEGLLPRGHTSGVDILVGVILALSIISDVQSDEYATASLARRLGL